MFKKQFLLVIAFGLLIASCDRKPFVEHKVSLDAMGSGCNTLQAGLKLTSNFGGERYEFQKCLPSNYDKKSVTSIRSGDTVIVHFPSIADAYPKTLYQVTLDIDSYPKYNFIQIDGEVIPIASSSN